MIYVIAIVAFLAGSIITRYFYAKKIAAIQLAAQQAENAAFHPVYTNGWDDGFAQGRRNLQLEIIELNRKS